MVALSMLNWSARGDLVEPCKGLLDQHESPSVDASFSARQLLVPDLLEESKRFIRGERTTLLLPDPHLNKDVLVPLDVEILATSRNKPTGTHPSVELQRAQPGSHLPRPAIAAARLQTSLTKSSSGRLSASWNLSAEAQLAEHLRNDFAPRGNG